MRRCLCFPVAVALFGVLSAPGCSSKPTQIEENTAAPRLRKIMQAYDIAIYKGKIPQNADDLKPFLLELAPNDNPEEILRSPNDNEPYEVVWGTNLDRIEERNVVVAYEKTGVNGVRYVITNERIVKTMTDDEFRQANIARGKKPRTPR
jgi:hypothetical protein